MSAEDSRKEMNIEQLDAAAGGEDFPVSDFPHSLPSNLARFIKCGNCGHKETVPVSFHGTLTCPECGSSMSTLTR